MDFLIALQLGQIIVQVRKAPSFFSIYFHTYLFLKNTCVTSSVFSLLFVLERKMIHTPTKTIVQTFYF
ncbi:hypothetical protein Bsph_0145 [Lysinibacillus sphaericus C3-41]|uniref:Uncharacterized protein n=1 Tax=Lysinibacillus sphaericus (strain C3-41) TaxID=444177 RepID=B1HT27_LYSSC|nr:hypothetical protein Bsph_0145 [Lysinibacillus sphaericus C3-41]